MIDLPFFGESEWKDERAPVLPQDWDNFLKDLVKHFPCEEVHFLAFSLGAKIALSLFQATDIPIKGVTLVSPDGLRIHPLYRFCIYNPIGKAIFYSVLRWPGLFLFVLKALYKLRITDAFKFRFVSKQFDTEEKRNLLRRVWRGHSKIRPDIDAIARRSAEIQTKWHIIWGDGDNILSVNLCKDFIQKVNGANLHVVQGGHFLLHPLQDEVRKILSSIFDAS